MSQLKYGVRTGRWQRICKGVYGEGPKPPSLLDRQRAQVLSAGGIASGLLAGVMHGFDGVCLSPDRGPLLRRRHPLPDDRTVVIAGIRCTSPLQTILDLAPLLDDDHWEQALESGLYEQRFRLAEVEQASAHLSARRVPGSARARRVLDRRPPGAPPTESCLETLFMQLARNVEGLGDPARQHVVTDAHGAFVARVDFVWLDLGLFIELDGQHHKGQPVYDARRETAVVAATGWLCGRFTWSEIVYYPVSTLRRLAALVAQARRRPVAN